MVVSLIESTNPDYFNSLATFLSSISNVNRVWVKEVGRALNTDRMLNQFEQVSPGEVESVFKAMSILRHLSLPIRRSTIRRLAEAFGRVLENWAPFMLALRQLGIPHG